MLSHMLAALALLAIEISATTAVTTAVETQSLYGQCRLSTHQTGNQHDSSNPGGGLSYTGPTKCPKTAMCYNDGTNPWYSQCVVTPWDNGGHPSSTTVVTTHTSKPSVTTVITVLPTRTTKPVTGGTTTVTLTPDEPFTDDRKREEPEPVTILPEADSIAQRQASGPGTTLQSGWYWIRAVVQPNYHKYLQTKPANAAGTAILESYKTAGQYNVIDGQLVANTGTGGAPLYLSVEKPTDFTQRTLATWFNSTKNEFGTFAFQGDALTWSTPEVKRQNLAAWLVCAKQALFINTGAYAYQTPSGCADQTIHYYNDAHANE
ncbi:hypothetical protein F5Y19DRAFT_486210 [Xylariaceae sp. FL1651]|nr:hypothetical protein F5Y19DRAFT_486210 [Xylariaceae sp. FL1651]